MKRVFLILFWVSAISFLLGALGIGIFVLAYAPLPDIPVRTAILNGPPDRPYRLAFVQFDDDGHFREPRQLENAVQGIRSAEQTGAVVVVFVHGWNNSCADCGQSLECFKELLAFLGELQRKYESPGHPARQVYGVYAGWRGISVRPPWYSRASTFEDRRAAADRVGRAGDLRKLLTRINEARSEIGRNHFSPLLFAGHSLGGRALLRALTTDGQGRTDISDLQKFADLYVLLNPAISAADYLLVDQQASRMEWKGGAPRLVVLASESDYVTQMAYPFSEDKLWPMHLDNDQLRVHYTTIGNYTPFVTHTLMPTSGIPKPTQDPATIESCRCASVQPEQLASILATRRPGNGDVFDYTNYQLPDGQDGKPYNVKLIPNGITRGAYMVVRVDRRLMNGHSDIYTPAVVDFLIRLANTRFIKEAGQATVSAAHP